jgi:hypothetical protein
LIVEIVNDAPDAVFTRILLCLENLHALIIDLPIVKITRESALGTAFAGSRVSAASSTRVSLLAAEVHAHR